VNALALAYFKQKTGRHVRLCCAPHLKNVNARYLPHAIGELKHIQSTSLDVEQKPLNIHNSDCKGRIVFNLGHELLPSREDVQLRWPGNKDLFHR
jgi:hypothetical protein